MLRFDKSFNGFETVGTAYDFIALCCKRCKVEFANKRAEIDAMPNGGVTISVYTENDIETCRDVLFYVAQVLGGFFIINREGKLELRKYGKDPVMKVEQRHRFSSSFSDFITRYTAVSSTNKQTQIAEYYALDPDNGLTMNLGVNPLLQFGLKETREMLCRNIDEFKAYTTACADKGFNIDSYDSNKSYSAENSEGYKLSVSYQGNNVMSISVDEPEYDVSIEIECVENLLFSTYDVDVYIDDMFEGTIEHGATETFEVIMTKGTYEVRFENADDDEVIGKVTIDIQKDETLKYKISCTSSKISVETIVGTAGSSDDETTDNGQGDNTEETTPPETEAPKITVTMSEDDFIGMLYTDAEAKLREMGFTVFEYETLETEDINKPDDTIGAVEIKNWAFGKGDFAVGDTYESDAIVVLWYYICDEPEPNLTVDNCPELAAMLSNKAEIDDSYFAFATKYKGRVIEFDGRIDYCTKHGDFNTRFDYLVSAGDYDPDHQIGPSFKFENVAYYDLNTDLDTVSVGLNVRIVAEVVSFDSNSGLFYLAPVSVTGR